VLIAQPSEFDFIPNSTFGTIIATVQINGMPASGGDYIAAFDQDENCSGAVELIDYNGETFCTLPVYGNDATTFDDDEGIDAGETFTFRLWRQATGEILDHPMDIEPVEGWDSGLNGTPVPNWDFADDKVINFMRISVDEDGDGLSDVNDPDDNDPCNPDNNVTVCDTDGDGTPDGSDPYPNCAGELDECDVCNGSGPVTWYADADGDGLGDPNNSSQSCDRPNGFVSNNSDTDDTVSNVADVPTLSQWGLILLSLILLSISIVSVIQNMYSLASNREGSVSTLSIIPYFNAALFCKMLIKSVPLMLIIFVAISIVEDGWFVRNLVGTILKKRAANKYFGYLFI